MHSRDFFWDFFRGRGDLFVAKYAIFGVPPLALASSQLISTNWSCGTSYLFRQRNITEELLGAIMLVLQRIFTKTKIMIFLNQFNTYVAFDIASTAVLKIFQTSNIELSFAFDEHIKK